MTAALAAFRGEWWEIYSQYEVPVVIVQVQAPGFYLARIYTKYHEIAGFASCNKVQVGK